MGPRWICFAPKAWVVIGVWIALAGCAPEQSERRPNIVLYLIDTLRADRLGCYGAKGETSPAIDALARDAFVFERAMSQAPWTVPSVVSLMTSCFPTSHGVLGPGKTLSEEAVTLPHLLREAGYSTHLFSVSPFGGSATGLDRGYDERLEQPRIVPPVLEWIGARDTEQPFFLYVHTAEPHWPLHPRGIDLEADLDGEWLDRTNELFRRFRHLSHVEPKGEQDAKSKENLRGLVDAELQRRLAEVRRAYDAAVRTADRHLESVVEALRASGRWEDTIFIVLSDHGEEMYEHEYWLHDQSLYEELIHVPLIVRVPGSAAERIAQPVQLVDVLPTVLELLDLPTHEQIQGRSLAPLLRGEPLLADSPAVAVRDNPFPHDEQYGTDPELYTSRGHRETALVRGRWKLILHHDVDRASLYDLEADPAEQHDLALDHPDRVAAMRAELDQWHAWQQTQRLGAPAETELDDEQMQRLRELGYVK